MKSYKLLFAAVAAAGVGFLSANADDKSGEAKLDTKFLEHAMKGGMAEVKMGQLASQKGESSGVKQFGERLVKDHTEANQKMQTIAQKKNITASQETDKHQQKALDHLSQLSGAEFDKAFLQHAVQDHKKDIEKFQKQASEGEDPAIRSFASETLPTLKEHLRIAQTLSDNPNASIPELNEPAGAQPKSDAQPQQDSSQQSDTQQQPQQNQSQP